jgi:hypothetical protein
MRRLVLIVVFALLANPCPAAIITVDANAPPGGNGSSWVTAYNFLQDALADARSDPDVNEIRVAQGTYRPDEDASNPGGTGDRTATFQLSNRVAIRGGYAGYDSDDPNARDVHAYQTVLSGDLEGNDASVIDPRQGYADPTRADNSYHVVTASDTDETCALGGLVITGGNASGRGTHERGGGMYSKNGGPTVTNCLFAGNTAKRGAGMYCEGGSGTLGNCVFTGNAASKGGGIWCEGSSPMITTCEFLWNYAWMGGGVLCHAASNPQITDCIIKGNMAGFQGGGISASDGSFPVISRCLVTENSVTGGNADNGGGIMIGLYGRMLLRHCLVCGNKADRHGAGICIAGRSDLSIIRNCTIAGNAAAGYGGGAHCSSSSAAFTSCILWGNTAGTGEQLRIVGAVSIPDRSGHAAIYYSDVQGGESGISVGHNATLAWEQGNIGQDPCCVALGYWDESGIWVEGDYHLLPDSPCVDAGDPNYTPGPNETDLAGNPRIIGGRVDMGAYEYFVPPIEVTMRFTPQAFNPGSEGNWFKLHFVLPDGYDINDVDLNTPAQCTLMDTSQVIESDYANAYVNEEGLLEVEAGFERSAFALCLSQPAERIVTVMGLLAGTGGQDFHGTDTVKIINNTLQQVAAFADYWLEADCSEPDWCGGLDLDRNGAVNFADFALSDGCCIEVIAE